MVFEVINPATGKKLKSYKTLSQEQVVKRIKKADKVQQKWEKTTFAYRAKLMNKAADILEKDKKKYAEVMTLEMGKTLKSAISEVEKCAWVCRYYAEKAAEFLAPEVVATDASKSYVHFSPIGIVLAVMPWNFPLWQVFRFAAPALMAGNAGLLKHASNVPGSAKLIQAIFQKAGFPKGLFTNLLITSKMVADVIKNPLVKAVTLTGSEAAGKAVAETAGSAIKKSVLELGGSDAYLILEDADLEKAVEACVTSRLLNNGQSCIGAKRFVVVQSVYQSFLQLFKAKMAAAKMGNPRKKETDLGPMARVDLRDELHEQVARSVEMGAKCILGGKIPNRKGAFYPATILTNIQKGMPAYHEELFGPVAAVFKAKNEAAAIKLANDSDFGLGAAVFTEDVQRGEQIAAHHLKAGACFVNSFVKSDPRLPFGGIGISGYGRELSHYGIKEFVNVKTVYVK